MVYQKQEHRVAHNKKYNFKQLKLDFFQSDYLEAKPFIENTFGVWNWTLAKWTIGWKKDKQIRMDKRIDDAVAQADIEFNQHWKLTLVKVKKAKIKWVESLCVDLVGNGKEWDPNKEGVIYDPEVKIKVLKQLDIYTGDPTDITEHRLWISEEALLSKIQDAEAYNKKRDSRKDW